MTQTSHDSNRELVALVRADGAGELRDGSAVHRVHAADANGARGEVMERAIGIAMSIGQPIRVRTIDVDGIYHLIISETGGIDQVGTVEPLQPGDTDLTPEAPEPVNETEPAPQDDHDEPDWLHETISLPRESMMAALQQEPVAHDEPGRDTPAADLFAPTDAEPQQTSAVQSTPERPDTDALPIMSNLFADPRSADVGEDIDEFHDEGLDHDFDDMDDDADESDAAETGPGQSAPDATSALETDDASATADWTPRFARDSNPRARIALGGATDRPKSAFPEQRLFDIDDTLSEPPTRPHKPARVEPRAHPAPAGKLSNDNRGDGPTLDDFWTAREKPPQPVAEHGWRANLRRMTGGLINLGPGQREQQINADIDAIQRTFDGPRTIVVVNPKGGAHKTTTTLMIAATFGIYRGGYTLAWDNNETRGTLGWRSKPGLTTNTAVDLLRELPKFEISGGASINELDHYVRNQGHAKFDVLASDDDAASAAIIDDDAFSRLHRVLSRFYRIMVIDTGNNMRASNWEAAVDAADQLVIVSTAREDTAASAAWLADGLRERGYGDKLANAVTILSSPSTKTDDQLGRKLESHFSQLTREVVSVPYDHAFVGGGELEVRSLQQETRDAWRHATAVIARGL